MLAFACMTERLRIAFSNPFLGPINCFDHIFIGDAGIFRPCENAMFKQDHAWCIRTLQKGFLTGFGKIKPWHDIRHDNHLGKEFANDRFPVWLIGQRDNCIGMGVIYMLERKNCMEDRFDGRIW